MQKTEALHASHIPSTSCCIHMWSDEDGRYMKRSDSKCAVGPVFPDTGVEVDR